MSNDFTDADSPRAKPAKPQAPQTHPVAATDETRNERGEKHPAAAKAQTPGALLVRCPHCCGTVDFVDDGSLKRIVCAVCGNQFSLVGGEDTEAYHPGGGKTIANFRLIERGVHVRDCGRLELSENVNRRIWVSWVKLGDVRSVG